MRCLCAMTQHDFGALTCHFPLMIDVPLHAMTAPEGQLQHV